MSTLAPTVSPPPSVPAQGAARPWRFTRDHFYRMGESGMFTDQRVELIDGEVVVMPPMSDVHALGISLMSDALAAAFGPNHWVRPQYPLNLSPYSVPSPDVAVVAGNMRAFRGNRPNPTTAELVVEVSDSTLADDRRRKGSLYAAVGIQEYWILNIPDDALEVYRDPRPDATREFGFGYASLATLRAGDTVSPLAASAAVVRIDDLLPQ